MPSGEAELRVGLPKAANGEIMKPEQSLIGFIEEPPSSLEELTPLAPPGPAATPVCIKQELSTSNTADLEILEPAICTTISTKVVAKSESSPFLNCTDLQSTAFMPLTLNGYKLDFVTDRDLTTNEDTNDSCSGLEQQASPKSWTATDMDNALEALKTQNMSLTKASSAYGIPATTLWQRAHRLGIDTPKKEGLAKSWSEDDLNAALQALRDGVISANKASKAYGIPSSTLYKIARREGIRLAAPFNAAPVSWRRGDLDKALEAIRAGQFSVQRAASHFGIPSGTLYGRCKREGIELSRSNPAPWSENAMVEAIEAVRVGQMSINQAAIHYNLPYSSLYGRFKRVKGPMPETLQETPPIQTDSQSSLHQPNDHFSEKLQTQTTSHFFPHLYHMDDDDALQVHNENSAGDAHTESSMYINQAWFGIATTS